MTIKEWIEAGALAVTILGILWRLSSMTTRFEVIGQQQAAEITQIKNGLDRLSGLVIELTKVSGRLDRLEDRQLAEGKRLDEAVKHLWRRIPKED